MSRFVYISLLALSSVFSTSVYAVNLSLASVPLYLGGSNSPNIMFTLDDSGSMHWEHMPDSLVTGNWWQEPMYMFPRANSIYGAGDYNNIVPDFAPTNARSMRLRSNAVNSTFYSPKIRYLPWLDSVGTSMGNVLPTCAPHNPTNTGAGCRDLTINNTQSADWYTSTTIGAIGTRTTATRTFWPATYYNHTGGSLVNIANFQRVEIRTSTPTYVVTLADSVDRDDCTILSPTSVSCSYVQEMQNFANWYSYYRSRILTARAGVGRAFAGQGTNMRVGFGSINTGTTSVDGVSTRIVRNGVREFSGANRTAWFNSLYNHVMNPNGTPLRWAIDGVGQYFMRTDNRGPWSETPGTSSSSPHLSCRQSYNILMSDGYWNNGGPTVGNSDSTAGATITGPSGSFQYTPGPPFSDTNTNSLADVAMQYWKTDLRPGLTNDVPTNPADPAFWQHMVNFTVGLGVGGTLDPATDLPALTATTLQWPTVAVFDGRRVDDLWHAAVNSRGEFFSASNPKVFADKLADILANIVGRDSAGGTVALNSGSVAAGSAIYQSAFNSDEWTGQLFKLPLSIVANQLVIGADAWGGGLRHFQAPETS